MYLTININTEMFADYVFLFILLGLVEKDNEDFLLNKSEAWNKLIDLIGIGSKKSNFILYTPLLKRVLENSVIEAREKN